MKLERFTARMFLDFVEDGRVSMENYATELSTELAGIGADRFDLDQFRPRYDAIRGLPSVWNDRIARYISYPRQVRGNDRDVNHIIDHGYAHLLARLPPNRTVVTVHDIIPHLANLGRIPGARQRRPWLGNHTLRHFRAAAALIAVSESTKRDIVNHVGVEESRIRVAHNGLSEDFRRLQTSREVLRTALGLPVMAPLVLITGRQFYKNHVTSIRVFGEVRRASPTLPPHLICLGRLTPDARALSEELGLASTIIELRVADRDALVSLYNAVDCLLFPSLYEGFGWPPLEAMACGTPVVCSRAGALPEIVGDAASMAEALDVASLRDAVLQLLGSSSSSSSRSAERVAAGLRQAGRYTWRAHAKAVLEVYEAVSAGR